MSNSVAFIVDGDLEKTALRKICKGAPVRHLGNGKEFPIHVIVKQVMTHVRILGNRYRHIVILYDLEKREYKYDAFAELLRSAISEAGIGEQSFSVHIKDRMVEDWILADREGLEGFLGFPLGDDIYRGKSGIKALLERAGRTYSEVPLGAELLASVVCSRAAARSPSLDSFMRSLPIDCWWKDR
jgi:hypothetical protein